MTKKEVKNLIIFVAIAVFVVLFDQGSKAWAFQNGGIFNDFHVIGDIVIFDCTYNTGAAFSFLAGVPWAQTFFKILTIIALVAFGFVFYKLPQKDVVAKLALVFIIGGAIGNLIDRFAMDKVRDFIYLSFVGANCNIADFFVVIGGVLIVVAFVFIGENSLLGIYKAEKTKKLEAIIENEKSENDLKSDDLDNNDLQNNDNDKDNKVLNNKDINNKNSDSAEK